MLDRIFIFLVFWDIYWGSVFEGMEGDYKDWERFLIGKGLEEMVSKYINNFVEEE